MKKVACVITAMIICLIGTFTAGKSSKRLLLTLSSDSVFYLSRTVIIDAGHGGEDGGAVAPDGTAEKEINLIISKGVADLCELFGVPYIQVRTDDVSLSDDGLNTVRERKRSDILNRYDLINHTENAVLLSIHQNMYSESKYSGTQVFYAAGVPDSIQLALMIQNSVTQALQPENIREIKPSTDSIFLLYRAKTTSVMVECGFLSNQNELRLLKTESYDAQMCYFIYKGLFLFLTT